jgi:hypothetical protein
MIEIQWIIIGNFALIFGHSHRYQSIYGRWFFRSIFIERDIRTCSSRCEHTWRGQDEKTTLCIYETSFSILTIIFNIGHYILLIQHMTVPLINQNKMWMDETKFLYFLFLCIFCFYVFFVFMYFLFLCIFCFYVFLCVLSVLWFSQRVSSLRI